MNGEVQINMRGVRAEHVVMLMDAVRMGLPHVLMTIHGRSVVVHGKGVTSRGVRECHPALAFMPVMAPGDPECLPLSSRARQAIAGRVRDGEGLMGKVYMHCYQGRQPRVVDSLGVPLPWWCRHEGWSWHGQQTFVETWVSGGGEPFFLLPADIDRQELYLDRTGTMYASTSARVVHSLDILNPMKDGETVLPEDVIEGELCKTRQPK